MQEMYFVDKQINKKEVEEARTAINEWLEKYRTYWKDESIEWLVDKYQYIFNEIFFMKDVDSKSVIFDCNTLQSLLLYLNRLIEENRIMSGILPTLLCWHKEITHLYSLVSKLNVKSHDCEDII